VCLAVAARAETAMCVDPSDSLYPVQIAPIRVALLNERPDLHKFPHTVSFAINNVSPAPIAGFNYTFPAECVMASFLGKESVMEQRVWGGGPTSFFSSPTE
jgi:hypothetical protein